MNGPEPGGAAGLVEEARSTGALPRALAADAASRGCFLDTLALGDDSRREIVLQISVAPNRVMRCAKASAKVSSAAMFLAWNRKVTHSA